MKAAVVKAWGEPPEYTDFAEPAPRDGTEVATVEASALTNLTRGLMSGNHYASKEIQLPAIAGVDGVGTAGGRPAGVHRRDRAVRHDGRAGAGQSGGRDPASRRRRPRHRSRDSESRPFGLDVIGLRRRGQAGGACAGARRNRGHRVGGGAAGEVGVRRAAGGRGGPQRRAAAVVAHGWGRRRHRTRRARTLALASPPRTPSGRSTPFSTTCGANPPKRRSQRWRPARPPRIITPPGSCRSVRWQARR